jgi:hypothetical protein
MKTELAFASWDTIGRRVQMMARGKCSPAESAMPKSPRGEKRPGAVGAAVRVTRISVGDEPDDRQDMPAPSPAAQLGKLSVARLGHESITGAQDGDRQEGRS